jgi:DNA transformation protein
VADPFHDFVIELLDGMGPVSIRKMFGGAGVYADGLMFGLIAGDVLHLKVDDALKAELTQEGSGPFVWEPQNGPRKGEKVDLGYWRLPEGALDDPDEAVTWARKALAVARAKAAAKAPRRKRKN